MDIKQNQPTTVSAKEIQQNTTGNFPGFLPFMENLVIRTMKSDLALNRDAKPPLPAPSVTAKPTAPPAQTTIQPPSTKNGSVQEHLKKLGEQKKKEPTLNQKEQEKLAKEEIKKQKQALAAAKIQQEKDKKEKAIADKIASKEQAAIIAQQEKEAKKQAEQNKKQRQNELTRLLTDAKTALAMTDFEKAASDSSVILQDPEAGWFLHWEASRILKQAQKALVASAPPSVPAPSLPITPPSTEAPQETEKIIPIREPFLQTDESPLPSVAPILPSQTSAQNELNKFLQEDLAAAPAIPTPAPPPELPVLPSEVSAPEIKETAPSLPPTEFQSQPLTPPSATAADLLNSLNQTQIKSEGPTAQPLPAKTSLFKLNCKKTALISFVILLFLAAAGSFIFLCLSGNFTPAPSLSATPSQSAKPTPQLPAPLFRMENREIISLDNDRQAHDLLANFAISQEVADSFSQIIFSKNASFLSFADVLRELNLSLFDLPLPQPSQTPDSEPASAPPSDLATTPAQQEPLIDLLSENTFSLFVYNQAPELKQPQDNSPFSGASQNFGRAGLIIKITAADPAILKEKVKALEPQMAKGLFSLFLNNNFPISESPVFSDNLYRDVAIRYLNSSSAELSVDYAIVNGYLALTTSKASMYALIDRLLAE